VQLVRLVEYWVWVPQASAIADCAAARDDYYQETGNYVPVIGDGGLITGGDICSALPAARMV